MAENKDNSIAAPAVSAQRIWTYLVSLALIAGAVAAAFIMPWREIWAALARADLTWLLAALLMFLATQPIGATQWWLYIPRQFRPGWGRVFGITSLTAMARASLPFLGGDASSIGLLVTRAKVDPAAAVLVVTLDQLFNGLGKVAMICATLTLASLPPRLAAAGLSLAILVACALIALLAAAIYGKSLSRLATLFPARLERAILAIAALTLHLELLRHPSRAALALVATLARKAIEVAVTLAVQRAVGIHLPIWSAILFVTAIDLAGVVPGPPAGLGIFEAAGLFIYRFLGVPPGAALVAAVLQHAIYLCVDFGMGYAVLITGQIRQRVYSAHQRAG